MARVAAGARGGAGRTCPPPPGRGWCMPPNSALTPSSSASIDVDIFERASNSAFDRQTVDHDATAVTWHNNNKYYEHNGGARTVHINNNTRQQKPGPRLLTVSPPSNNNWSAHCSTFCNSSEFSPPSGTDGRRSAWMAVEQSPRSPLGGGLRAAVRRRASLLIFSRDPASKLGGAPPPPSPHTHPVTHTLSRTPSSHTHPLTHPLTRTLSRTPSLTHPLSHTLSLTPLLCTL